MKAISLWQPWASLIAEGEKCTETRSWPTSHTGPLAIHAALRWTHDQVMTIARSQVMFDALIKHGYNWPVTGRKGLTLPLGAIVAIVHLEKCEASEDWMKGPGYKARQTAFGDMGPGRFVWTLSRIQKLSAPIPWRGRQQMFTLPPDIAAECERRAA